MTSFEDLFTSSELDVIVPESSITFPPGPNVDEWLDQLNQIDRKEAFFDEHLQTLFTLRVPHPGIPQELTVESPEPPRLLLDFLAHVQVLLEASYISPIAPNDDNSEYTVSASPLPSSRLNPTIPSSPPPRTSSIKRPTHLNLSGLLSPNPGSASHHPSILPPSTPNPMPASAVVDQRYLQAEGVVLTSRIWGQDVSKGGAGLLDRKHKDSEGTDRAEGFYLLWAKSDKVWVAVYKTVLDIAFLRLNFDSPLLCLTFSATLRDKPLTVSSSKSPLAVYLQSVDGISTPDGPISPTSPSTPVTVKNDPSAPETDPEVGGPPEINLLAGLYAGPTFAPASSLGKRPPSTKNNTPTSTPTPSQSINDGGFSESDNDLTLSSTRLGPVSRAKLFALPPIEPETPTSSAMITPTLFPGQSALPSAPGHFRHHTLGGRGKPVLRKSFRKILETASGFKVRMRTVFVPAVLLDEGGSGEEFEDVGLGDDEEHDDGHDGDGDEYEDGEPNDDEDPDRLTSGASERTVVLCVEIETEGDPFYRPADAPDFVVEKVDISITGSAAGGAKEEGATARLIGWDTANRLTQKGGAKRKKKEKQIPKSSSESQAGFPLYLAPHEQHNLLYAVSFLHSPQEDAALDGLGSVGLAASLTSGVAMNALPSAGVLGPNGAVKPSGPDKSLQRGVTIEVFGKPCYGHGENPSNGTAKVKTYHYPTPTFISRWNCVLDLSLSQQAPRRSDFSDNHEYGDEYADYGGNTPLPTINALPEPPSPFPVPVSTISTSFTSPTTSSHFPPSSSFPSIASVVSPNERRALGSLGFGLDLGLGSGNRKSSLGLLAFPSASGPATTRMATTEKRHTLPNLPRILPSHVQSAGPGLGHNLGTTIERPGSALGPSRERRDSAKGGVQGVVQGRQRRDSLPIPSPNASGTSKYTPPSVSAAITAQSFRSPTTYEAPPPPPFKDRGGGGGVGLSVTIPPSIDQAMGLTQPAATSLPPVTPAYPAFPINNGIPRSLPTQSLDSQYNGPPTPLSQGPLIPHGGNLPPNSANLSGIGYIGPSVEVKRERGLGVGVGIGGGYGGYGGFGGMGSTLASAIPSAIPQTPLPVIGFGTPAPGGRPRGDGGSKLFDGDAQRGGVEHVRQSHDEGANNGINETGSQSIIVSVGVLPQQSTHHPQTSFESSTPLPSVHSRPSSPLRLPEQLTEPKHSSDTPSNSISGLNFSKHAANKLTKPVLIYPLSTFILDIFVFNRSTWTRRFEISCPDQRSRRKRREIESFATSRRARKRRSGLGAGVLKGLSIDTSDPGVLPLENRVRIGPLLPSACQSVRMKFLAVSPGVHSIDTLTLTDVESGLAMNLRSVMDIVVHEPT
ncbi:TRAPP trafficking subunit Trs65-domain-containing protein [Lentinula aciculospora]|uniref:TRAPP trafficking subunit Trs65-domain-containing protein n=1 Tax=Lentinula aciculospora TaxID=153920 RepID=A0A9W8ZWK7_9AGAR|nr:TRAPP trafficking subunit Trs65-domain-containing protein [Lentinula aciculospora]